MPRPPVRPAENARPLLIGAAPGPNTKREHPLLCIPKTSAGGRLQQLMGISRVEYLRRFDRINLIAHYPGATCRGDKFPMGQAKSNAEAMRPLLIGRKVILVGSGPRDAFGLSELDWHTWQRCPVWGATDFVAVPHPSGRNHWYNKEDNRRQAEEFWRRFAEENFLEA
jgi:uracil-DNA glycosylase